MKLVISATLEEIKQLTTGIDPKMSGLASKLVWCTTLITENPKTIEEIRIEIKQQQVKS